MYPCPPLWAQLMAHKLDDDVERDAIQMADDKEVTEERLHTAAMVLLERGRAQEAALLGVRRQAQLDGEVDPEQWLLRARLLQLLGFDEESRAAYVRVGDKDNELSALRKRWLATAPGAGGRGHN